MNNRAITMNRMEAKPIPGEHCHFCGDDRAPLVITPCCGELICCDTAYMSYRGGGRCQFEHENESICHFHYNDKHQGEWHDCAECSDLFGDAEFEWMSKAKINTPHY